VWLVKTHPVHVKQWGTFVSATVAGGDATVAIRTEVNNHGKDAQNARDVDDSRSLWQASGKVGTATASVGEGGEQTYEQMVIRRPLRWSLKERNLYRLVTEVSATGEILDHYETPLGIRSVEFDAQKGFFLNGKSVKVKGSCSHQDHAGLGAALPCSTTAFASYGK
jgi:beta-galactosidase